MGKSAKQTETCYATLQHHATYLCIFPVGKSAEQWHVMQHHTNFLCPFHIGKSAEPTHRDVLSCSITLPLCALSLLVNELNRQHRAVRAVMQCHATFVCTFPAGKWAKKDTHTDVLSCNIMLRLCALSPLVNELKQTHTETCRPVTSRYFCVHIPYR